MRKQIRKKKSKREKKVKNCEETKMMKGVGGRGRRVSEFMKKGDNVYD